MSATLTENSSTGITRTVYKTKTGMANGAGGGVREAGKGPDQKQLSAERMFEVMDMTLDRN